MLCVTAAGKQKDTDKGKYLVTRHTQQGPSSSHFLRTPLYAPIQERCSDGPKPFSFTCLSVICSTSARIKFQYLNILGDTFKSKTITIVIQDMKIPWKRGRAGIRQGLSLFWMGQCLSLGSSQSITPGFIKGGNEVNLWFVAFVICDSCLLFPVIKGTFWMSAMARG